MTYEIPSETYIYPLRSNIIATADKCTTKLGSEGNILKWAFEGAIHISLDIQHHIKYIISTSLIQTTLANLYKYGKNNRGFEGDIAPCISGCFVTYDTSLKIYIYPLYSNTFAK